MLTIVAMDLRLDAVASPRNYRGNSWTRSHVSIAIRHALEHRAARPARVGRVLHRHHALALADDHALADDDRGSVADDHARVRRDRAGARAVRPDDRIARKHPAPAVVADH